jgi:putative hydrolase of HD superfamily
MQELVNFFSEVGKLKEMPRRGWVIREIKNPETIAEHIFRATLLAWILARSKKSGLNLERVMKIALIHDLCEVYAGDTTPYDSILPRNKKKWKEIVKTWPRFSEAKKKELALKKYKKEKKGLEKLILNLPQDLRKEMKNLWLDYEKGLTPEGRFFKQADRVENFLQAVEYWKKYNRTPQKPWWLQAREMFDDPVLLDFIKAIDKKFHKKKKPKI